MSRTNIAVLTSPEAIKAMEERVREQTEELSQIFAKANKAFDELGQVINQELIDGATVLPGGYVEFPAVDELKGPAATAGEWEVAAYADPPDQIIFDTSTGDLKAASPIEQAAEEISKIPGLGVSSIDASQALRTLTGIGRAEEALAQEVREALEKLAPQSFHDRGNIWASRWVVAAVAFAVGALVGVLLLARGLG